ncbi:MAG: hypothetical protein N0C90_24325 [Candidatus Thiodiazotropha endolucinida]|nr:hypothetical protein [Candidatus Thiodiazotropha taylori]MCW4264477.1 hypothetical protein [Candidatus Thiodiazotropha endolucinida]
MNLNEATIILDEKVTEETDRLHMKQCLNFVTHLCIRLSHAKLNLPSIIQDNSFILASQLYRLSSRAAWMAMSHLGSNGYLLILKATKYCAKKKKWALVNDLQKNNMYITL